MYFPARAWRQTNSLYLRSIITLKLDQFFGGALSVLSCYSYTTIFDWEIIYLDEDSDTDNDDTVC